MQKIRDLFPNQLELGAQIEEVLEDVGTVIILQGCTGVGGATLGTLLKDNYGFKYSGRGIYSKDGVLGKMIIVLDRHADGTRFIHSVDVYYETTVINAAKHFHFADHTRPELLHMDEAEMKDWRNKFEHELDDMLD